MSATLDDLMLSVGVVSVPEWFSKITLPFWPMPHQLETVKVYARNSRYADFSDPGCVSADTEFLSPTGWKRIDQWNGEEVAQFHPDEQTMSFVHPHRYVKEPCEEMYLFRPTKGVDMKLSKCHRVLHFAQNSGRYRVDSAERVKELHEDQVNGFRGLFCTTPRYSGTTKIPLTHQQLRVQAMVLADGSFTAKVGTRCDVRVLKERKKARCRWILKDAGIPFKEYEALEGYSVFNFYAPLREKTFPLEWWDAPVDQKEVLLDEVRHWDGSDRKASSFTYTSLHKPDADFVQFLATSCGRNSTTSTRRHKILEGKWFLEHTTHVSGRGNLQGIYSSESKTKITTEPTEDGYMYCFSVPSTFLVLRRGGRVFTTGNCGKTFPAHIHGILMAALGNKVCFIMPPKLIGQFQDEMEDFFVGITDHLQIANLDVPAAKKVKQVDEWDANGWPDILMLSYDVYRMLNDPAPTKAIGRNRWFLEDGTPYWKEQDVAYDKTATPYTKDGRRINSRGRAANSWQFKLNKAEYNVLFFDEAHALCGTDSILSKSVKAMSDDLGDDIAIYLMTGTPVPTHLHDAYGIIRLINPEAYQSYAAFERQHCDTSRISVRGKGGKEVKVKTITGYRNTDKVHESLFANARRVQKRDVITMPDPVIGQIRVKLSGKHKRLYDKIINDHFAVVGDTVLAPDSQSEVRALALRLISCPDEFDPSLSKDNEVAAAADAYLDSVNPANFKVIIFAYHRTVIEFLAKRYEQWNPAVVYGGSSGNEQVKRFKEDDSCRIAIINWVSGGAGLNLQIAHHILFYECPTSPKDAKQAIARADRKGQANIVNAVFLRVMGTLSDKNFKNLLKNEASNNQVVQDTKDLLHELLKKS